MTNKRRESEKIVSWKTCKGKPPNDTRYVRSEMYMSVVFNLNKKIALIIVEHCIKCLLHTV